MDTYQAVYDAVRSKISGGDVDGAIHRATVECLGNIDHRVNCSLQEITAEQTRPFTLMRPKMYIDGNLWCALYGENIQDGIAGFGETPNKAAWDFDAQWSKSLSTQPQEAESEQR